MIRSMRSQAIVVLIFALVVAIANCNSEGDALYSWKLTLKDPNNVLQSWDPTLSNPCIWFHVTCNFQNSVVRVDLANAGLSGPIVPQLGQLANLQYLEVFGNKLSGAIPAELGNLTSLISLDLYNNQLSGPIPEVLGKLKNLRFVRLNNNKLSGKIPETVIQLISYGNLQILNVSDNHLAGTVPATQKTGFAITTVIQDPKA